MTSGFSKYQILLVEDNPADVYLMKEALTQSGLIFELTVIDDGARALAFVGREVPYAEAPRPDLAVLDMNLPKNSGDDVLAAIRSTEHLRDMPVVVTTSSASPAEQSKMKALGVTLQITKPADLEEFMKIGDVLRDLLLTTRGRPVSAT